MKTKTFLLVITTFILLVSCSPNEYISERSNESKETMKTGPDDGLTSENALDWDGTYIGTVQGIKQVLTLENDKTYNISEYSGGILIRSGVGTFVWDSTGSVISLSGTVAYQYQVGENKLIRSDIGAILLKI